MKFPYPGVAETKKVRGRHGRRYRQPMASLIDRHAGNIVGILSCLDRVVIQGTIPSVCHAKAVETLLRPGVRQRRSRSLTRRNSCFTAMNRPAYGLPPHSGNRVVLPHVRAMPDQ